MPYVGQTITEVFPTSISLDTVTALTSLKTPLVEFTDGDNAFTISDGGNVAFTGTVSGASMDLLSTITASTDSTIDFTGLFTSAYTDYEIRGSNIHASADNVSSHVRVFVGGSVKSDSHYRFARIRNYSGDAAYAGAVGAAEAEFTSFCGEHIGNAAGEGTNFRMTIYNPLGTDNFKAVEIKTSTVDRSGDHFHIHGSGHYKNGVAALTGIRFLISSGTIASGIFKLYGKR